MQHSGVLCNLLNIIGYGHDKEVNLYEVPREIIGKRFKVRNFRISDIIETGTR